MRRVPPNNKKETTMLRKFAAVLLATSLIAGPAFAAGAASTTPAPTSVGTTIKAPAAVKTVKSVKHKRKHARRHSVRGASVAMNQTRHVKHSSKTHRTHVAKVTSKSAHKNTGKSMKRSHVHTAKLPTTRTGTN
jgi:hypothetical protein